MQETMRDGTPYDPHTRAEAVSVGDKMLDEVLGEMNESIENKSNVVSITDSQIDEIWNETYSG